jgi:hypothetical protein
MAKCNAMQQSSAFPLAATASILILAATHAQPPTLATSITSSVELVWLAQLFLLPQPEVFSYCYATTDDMAT